MTDLSKQESIKLITGWIEDIYKNQPSLSIMELKYKLLEQWNQYSTEKEKQDFIYAAIEEYEKWIS